MKVNNMKPAIIITIINAPANPSATKMQNTLTDRIITFNKYKIDVVTSVKVKDKNKVLNNIVTFKNNILTIDATLVLKKEGHSVIDEVEEDPETNIFDDMEKLVDKQESMLILHMEARTIIIHGRLFIDENTGLLTDSNIIIDNNLTMTRNTRIEAKDLVVKGEVVGILGTKTINNDNETITKNTSTISCDKLIVDKDIMAGNIRANKVIYSNGNISVDYVTADTVYSRDGIAATLYTSIGKIIGN